MANVQIFPHVYVRLSVDSYLAKILKARPFSEHSEMFVLVLDDNRSRRDAHRDKMHLHRVEYILRVDSRRLKGQFVRSYLKRLAGRIKSVKKLANHGDPTTFINHRTVSRGQY